MSAKGLLLVTMEPPAGLEDEFNDWYDTEHVPQRAVLPGFESASRWACVTGWPRWLALYDLASVAAVETAAYRAVSGDKSTPWSKRILPRTIGRQRVVAEQVAPGNALGLDPARCARLLVARYKPRSDRAFDESALRRFGEVRGIVQCRLFRSVEATDSDVWLIAAFDQPISNESLVPVFGRFDDAGATLFNLYVPYQRG